MTKVFTTIAPLRDYLNSLQTAIGLVPTMGALHVGHVSLIHRAKQEHDCVVVSIFVNPLQFGAGEDYLEYPRDLESDRLVCEKAGIDIIFAPLASEIYGVGETTMVIPPASLTSGLCGRSRVGHFTGVATVVTKLLNIIQPQRAYFGQKDGQQLAIIRQVVKDLHIPTEVVACPIVRSASGLALSSRNQYLNSEDLGTAASLYQALKVAETTFNQGEHDGDALIFVVKEHLSTYIASQQIDLEYIELVDLVTLEPVARVVAKSMLAIAARVGNTRLIDNIILNVNSEY